MSEDKPKFLRDMVARIGEDLCGLLADVAVRVQVVGSVRRGKRLVGDLEVLILPLFGDGGRDLLGAPLERVNLAKVRIEKFIEDGKLAKRRRADGKALVGWGGQNCFAVHVRTGLPIDFFFASEENWVSLLVCRTGPAGLNVILCQQALNRGMRWDPYVGLVRTEGGDRITEDGGIAVASEEDFFLLLGVPYFEPERRCLLLNDSVRNDPDRRAV